MGICVETGVWENMTVTGCKVGEKLTFSLTVVPMPDIISLFDLEYIGDVVTLRQPVVTFVTLGGCQYAQIEDKGDEDIAQRYFVPLEAYQQAITEDLDPETKVKVFSFDWHITPAGWLMEYELEAVAA